MRHLVGCGSGSDSSFEVDEYSISAYEGRSVSTETLASTWVAVGTGSISSVRVLQTLPLKSILLFERCSKAMSKLDVNMVLNR